MSSLRPNVLCIALLAAILAYASPARTEKSPSPVEAAIADWNTSLAQLGVVGTGVLCTSRSGTDFQAFSGSADLDSQRAMAPDTIIRWASISKVFTAMAVVQLSERGLLGLDDPLTRYVPELRAMHNPFGSMDAITIRQALRHTSGLPGSSWPWIEKEEPWHPPGVLWSQLVAMMPYTQVQFEPGSQTSYSNAAFNALGQVVARVSRDDYEVYVDKNVLKPLGMHETYFDEAPLHLGDRLSASYQLGAEGAAVPVGRPGDVGDTTANGGLTAPFSDMLRFAAFLAGSSQAYPVLQRAVLEAMWADASPMAERSGYRQSIGTSFFVIERESGGDRLVGHTGQQWFHQSWLLFDPDQAKACITATNTYGGADEAAAARVTSTTYADVLTALWDAYFFPEAKPRP